ncbi:MAG: hypothetical protein K2X93_15120 [Candidatus Obscuribacterales bacterium]|nr:hypothetical protein [Candidatus Obscuribacterales bacterium]
MADNKKSSSNSKTRKVVAKTKAPSSKINENSKKSKRSQQPTTQTKIAAAAKPIAQKKAPSKKVSVVEQKQVSLPSTKRVSTRTKAVPVKKVTVRDERFAQEIVTLSQFKKKQLEEVLAELGRRDRKLKALIPRVEGGFSLKTKDTDSPFAAIAEAIVYQQLTGKAAATIFGRVKAVFESDLCPTPQQIKSAPDTVLRSAGLSRSKIVALKDLADKTIEGLIPTLEEINKMTDDEVITCLSAVKGVGVWTAQMFLIFRLGRLDIMPSGDYGVKKGFSLTYGDGESLPSSKEMESFAEVWRPYRTVGSWYMWRAIELQKAALIICRLSAIPRN